jgi:hypothetical protein
MLEVANWEVAYDYFGNEYGVGLDFGSYVRFGIGLAVLLLAALSAGQNKIFRGRQSDSQPLPFLLLATSQPPDL